MKLILYLSQLTIPFLIFTIVALGLMSKVPVYDSFIRGAKEGLKTVAGILPTLIGLMIATGILRASGLLDFIGTLLGSLADIIHFPAELVPLGILRMFSSSAATGLLLDIFKEFGTDSPTGLMAAILLSSTESVFYCMSVYYGSVKIEKTRYTLPGALLATAAGAAAAVCIVNLIC